MNKGELMSLEDAITHANEVAEEKYTQGFLCHANPDDGKLDECVKCGREHEQLAKWLSELKQYQEIGTVKEFKLLKDVISKIKLSESESSNGIPLNFSVTFPQTDYDILKDLGEPYISKRGHVTLYLEISEITVNLDNLGTETSTFKPTSPIKIWQPTGSMLGGSIEEDFKKNNGEPVHIKDYIDGYLDSSTDTLHISSAAQKVVSVVFSGWVWI